MNGHHTHFVFGACFWGIFHQASRPVYSSANFFSSLTEAEMPMLLSRQML
jgi:hypothetical protein